MFKWCFCIKTDYTLDSKNKKIDKIDFGRYFAMPKNDCSFGDNVLNKGKIDLIAS